MSVKITGVIPAYLHKVNVQWELDSTTAPGGPYTYELERSGSPNGPWETVTAAPVSTIYAEDPYVQLWDFNRDLYYRVKAVSPTLTVTYSDSHSLTGDMDRRRWLLWRKMNYDEEIMLKKGNGVPMKVLKKKHMGTRCTKCYDPATGMSVLSKCPTCKGTTWEIGYYPAIDTWGHIKPSATRTDDTNQTNAVGIDTGEGFLLNFPQVIKDDIIIETRTNTRWRVSTEQSTELIRSTVHQDLVISRIPRDSIEYSIGV